jgi:hypothetical protein
MAVAATAWVRDRTPAFLFYHSMRVFAFAALYGKRRGVDVDLELLYVGALFHGVGLTDAYLRSVERFEIDGADAARIFLRGYHASETAIDQVWDAIALHMTPGIPAHKAPIVALIAAGVETNLLGTHLDSVAEDQCRQILAAFPRENSFKLKFIDCLGRAMAHRPQAAYGNVCADVLERTDPKYRRLNFCGRVLGANWSE